MGKWDEEASAVRIYKWSEIIFKHKNWCRLTLTVCVTHTHAHTPTMRAIWCYCVSFCRNVETTIYRYVDPAHFKTCQCCTLSQRFVCTLMGFYPQKIVLLTLYRSERFYYLLEWIWHDLVVSLAAWKWSHFPKIIMIYLTLLFTSSPTRHCSFSFNDVWIDIYSWMFVRFFCLSTMWAHFTVALLNVH